MDHEEHIFLLLKYDWLKHSDNETVSTKDKINRFMTHLKIIEKLFENSKDFVVALFYLFLIFTLHLNF